MKKDSFPTAIAITTFQKFYEDIIKELEEGQIEKATPMIEQFLERTISFVDKKNKEGEAEEALAVGLFIQRKIEQIEQMIVHLEDASAQSLNAMKKELEAGKGRLRRSEQKLKNFRQSFKYKMEYLLMHITNFEKSAQEVIYLLEADIIKQDWLEKDTGYFFMFGEKLLHYAEYVVQTTSGDDLNMVKERLVAHYPKQRKQQERISELSSKVSTPKLKDDLVSLSEKLEQFIESLS